MPKPAFLCLHARSRFSSAAPPDKLLLESVVPSWIAISLAIPTPGYARFPLPSYGTFFDTFSAILAILASFPPCRSQRADFFASQSDVTNGMSPFLRSTSVHFLLRISSFFYHRWITCTLPFDCGPFCTVRFFELSRQSLESLGPVVSPLPPSPWAPLLSRKT